MCSVIYAEFLVLQLWRGMNNKNVVKIANNSRRWYEQAQVIGMAHHQA